jgi:hypothetical protein
LIMRSHPKCCSMAGGSTQPIDPSRAFGTYAVRNVPARLTAADHALIRLFAINGCALRRRFASHRVVRAGQTGSGPSRLPFRESLSCRYSQTSCDGPHYPVPTHQVTLSDNDGVRVNFGEPTSSSLWLATRGVCELFCPGCCYIFGDTWRTSAAPARTGLIQSPKT